MKPLHLLSVQILFSHPCLAILFPRDSTSRESKSLDGLWRFKLSPKDDPDIGFRESWFSAPLQVFVDRRLAASMSVAGRGCVAYASAKQLQWHHHRQRSEKNLNPIFGVFLHFKVRDFLGWAWYDHHFYSPPGWKTKRVVLRFSSSIIPNTRKALISPAYIKSFCNDNLDGTQPKYTYTP